MLTYQQLWADACTIYGRFIPPSTFRDWIRDFCRLEIKLTYEQVEIDWVVELARIAKKHPKGSPKIKKELHALMEECANAAN